jgi:hypothetical protein
VEDRKEQKPAAEGKRRLLAAYAIVALMALIAIVTIIVLSSGSGSAARGNPLST